MAATFMYQNYAPNNVQKSFMSEENARFLKGEVEKRLSATLNTKVFVPLDDYFKTHMGEIVNASLGPAPGVLGLAAINRTFINRMTNIQLYSISQGALTRKYYIDQDRPWTQPYGAYSGNDAVVVSPSNYMTSHPWSKRRDGFLAAALHLKPTPASSKQPNTQSGDALFVTNDTYCRTGPNVSV